MARRLGILLVCALLLAGCSALGGAGGGSDRFETVTPVPVQEPDPDAGTSTFPPGITRSGIDDLDRLTTNHLHAIANRSYVWTEWSRMREVRVNESNVVVTRSERMVVESPTVYNHSLDRIRYTVAGTQRLRRSTYADGREWHQRTVDESRTSYTAGTISTDRDQFAFAATFVIEQYFSAENTSVTRIRDASGTVYRVQNDDPGQYGEYWSDYSAVMYVEPSGFVRRLTVSYDIDRENGTDHVAYRFGYEQRGGVTTSPPSWLDRADGE
jgi:hypothetical protein